MNSRPEHERLFDEICNKLNELSHKSNIGPDLGLEGTRQQMLEKMQGQIRRFQSDLEGAQDELRDKIKNLENVQYQQNDMGTQMRLLSEQLNQERNTNTKLNTDLAKSLELSLQLQLEIQGLKARSQQVHIEEKKYNQSLLEKLKGLQNEVELHKALKDETDLELDKAKASFMQQQESWQGEKSQLQIQIQEAVSQKDQISLLLGQMNEQINEKNQQIAALNEEIQNVSGSFEELEQSAQKQTLVLKNLMETAETKIVEMKMALDRKSLECQDYYSHLQQSLTQAGILKSENANLKDHIEKINQYVQEVQAAQEAARSLPGQN
jgi:predicted  nucleic acid-binding Zn-ribbon protein